MTVTDGHCSSTDDILVTVATPPVTPNIYQIGNDLFSSASSDNQWYNDQGSILGAISQSYTPLVSGNYFVILTDANGCVSDTSNMLYVTLTGLTNDAYSKEINLFPNPAKHFVTINYKNYYEHGNYNLSIYGTDGKLVFVSVLKNKTMTLDVSQFPVGIYFLKLISEEGVFVSKFVVEK